MPKDNLLNRELYRKIKSMDRIAMEMISSTRVKPPLFPL